MFFFMLILYEQNIIPGQKITMHTYKCMNVYVCMQICIHKCTFTNRKAKGDKIILNYDFLNKYQSKINNIEKGKRKKRNGLKENNDQILMKSTIKSQKNITICKYILAYNSVEQMKSDSMYLNQFLSAQKAYNENIETFSFEYFDCGFLHTQKLLKSELKCYKNGWSWYGKNHETYACVSYGNNCTQRLKLKVQNNKIMLQI